MKVGIVAASSVVPMVEFDAGVAHLRTTGFDAIIHDQVRQQHYMFPGDDLSRAQALYDYGRRDDFDVIWMARGGYGAGRLLPILEELTTKHGKPSVKKLLVGYSDVTVLHEFVRQRWGWSTLHAPMPAASSFPRLDEREWTAIVDLVKRKPTAPPWVNVPLRWMSPPPEKVIHAELIGGNLSLWAALAGTPYAHPGKKKIVFLEDVDEAYYRIDRMMIQLEQSQAFDGAAAIALGDFTDCHDENNQCLADIETREKKPLRKVFEQAEAFEHIFVPLARRVGVPLAQGLSVGHGPN